MNNIKNDIRKETGIDADSAFDVLTSMIETSIHDAPNLQLPSPSLRNFYKDEADRIIWLQSEIDDSVLEIIKKIMEYNRQDKDIEAAKRRPIKLFINTFGGDVSVMWSLINAIKLSKTPIYTINFSNAMSAGAHILAAGHKRFGMPGSTVLIHSGSCTYSGTQEQAESAKKYYDALSKKTEEQLLKDTKIDKKVFKKKAPFDWYLDDQEALKNSVIDKIIDNIEEIL